jgi:hypothetical protein
MTYEFPFVGIPDLEFHAIHPHDYMEYDGQIFWNGHWYPLQEEYGPLSSGFWYPIDEGEELWYPLTDPGGSVFFVDETATVPFTDVTDEELLSLYPGRDPLDYVDPWPEVYDMEYLE